MPRFTKPPEETTGKGRICLSCFHCKTRIFRNVEELSKWCQRRDCHLRVYWPRKIEKHGSVQLYWCVKQCKGPRILRTCDKPFVEDCSLYEE